MSEFIFFIIGFLIGGLAGIILMCLLQINRINDDRDKNEEDL